jgi:hypothetical protein
MTVAEQRSQLKSQGYSLSGVTAADGRFEVVGGPVRAR